MRVIKQGAMRRGRHVAGNGHKRGTDFESIKPKRPDRLGGGGGTHRERERERRSK
jgi:hypothetical protein